MSQKTVALNEATYARLCGYRARLELAILAYPCTFPKWLQNSRLSLDDATAFLLDQQEKHGQRTKKAHGRKNGTDPNDVFSDADGFAHTQDAESPPAPPPPE